MTDQRVADLVEWVRTRPDCRVEPGLGDEELARAEETFRIAFPPLWRQVLAEVHPMGPAYPDWRRRGDATGDVVEAPYEGLLFDVAESDFWWHAWGRRPRRAAQRLDVARARLRDVPRLVPIQGHWYVAPTDDSPVFSVVQADLYVPALTIADLATGRSQSATDVADWPIGDVPFWSELHAYGQVGHVDARFGRLGRGGL